MSKWFPMFIDCSDLVAAGLYPEHTACCRSCHSCDKRGHRVLVSPPDKAGEYEMLEEEYEGGEPIGRVMLSFCCNVGFIALSRSEVAKLVKLAKSRIRRMNNSKRPFTPRRSVRQEAQA